MNERARQRSALVMPLDGIVLDTIFDLNVIYIYIYIYIYFYIYIYIHNILHMWYNWHITYIKQVLVPLPATNTSTKTLNSNFTWKIPSNLKSNAKIKYSKKNDLLSINHWGCQCPIGTLRSVVWSMKLFCRIVVAHLYIFFSDTWSFVVFDSSTASTVCGTLVQ